MIELDRVNSNLKSGTGCGMEKQPQMDYAVVKPNSPPQQKRNDVLSTTKFESTIDIDSSPTSEAVVVNESIHASDSAILAGHVLNVSVGGQSMNNSTQKFGKTPCKNNLMAESMEGTPSQGQPVVLCSPAATTPRKSTFIAVDKVVTEYCTSKPCVVNNTVWLYVWPIFFQ